MTGLERTVVMAVQALRLVLPEQLGWAGLRARLDRLAPGKDPYVIKMWREALMEADGQDRGPEADPLAFPYVPFQPERFGVPLSATSRVLDVGCLGAFGLFDFTVRRVREHKPIPLMFGVDVDRESLDLGSALAQTWTRPGQLSLQYATGESMPYQSGSFDLVLARSVLQYLRIEPALTELARLVRPGGLVLIQTHGLGYYAHQIMRHLRNPLQAAYYGRALMSGLLFSASCVQPHHRWFREAAITKGRLHALCQTVGLRPVWRDGRRRRPLALFVKV
jgi:SAM-dependent methyltransferase